MVTIPNVIVKEELNNWEYFYSRNKDQLAIADGSILYN